MKAEVGQRGEIAGELAKRMPQEEDKGIDFPHIFLTLLDDFQRRTGKSSRLAMLHQFATIERIVRAARQNDLILCARWEDELGKTRGNAQLPSDAQNVVDCALLPAVALADSKRGDWQGAVEKLKRSVTLLEGFHKAGIADAGIAILEQRLNGIRAFRGSTDEFGELVVEYIAEIFSNSVGNQVDLSGSNGYGHDKEKVQLYYLNELFFATFNRFRNEDIRGFLKLLEERLSSIPDAHAVLLAVRLLHSHLTEDCEPEHLEAIDYSAVHKLPRALQMALEVTSARHLSADEREDAFLNIVSNNQAYLRLRGTIEGSSWYLS